MKGEKEKGRRPHLIKYTQTQNQRMFTNKH